MIVGFGVACEFLVEVQLLNYVESDNLCAIQGQVGIYLIYKMYEKLPQCRLTQPKDLILLVAWLYKLLLAPFLLQTLNPENLSFSLPLGRA